ESAAADDRQLEFGGERLHRQAGIAAAAEPGDLHGRIAGLLAIDVDRRDRVGLLVDEDEFDLLAVDAAALVPVVDIGLHAVRIVLAERGGRPGERRYAGDLECVGGEGW